MPQDQRTTKAKTGHNRTTTSNGSRSGMGEDSGAFQLGLYGWRKKCLFLLVFALMLLIVLNLALTLWILKVMEFSAVSRLSIGRLWERVRDQ